MQFDVDVPTDLAPQTLVGYVHISQEGMPIGRVGFKVKVVDPAAVPVSENTPDDNEPIRYHQAFICYSSEDRPEVRRRVRILPDVGVRYVQDILTLNSGDEWWPKLVEWIDESDVFLLFWSSNAKKSEWVEKEWRRALEREEPGFIRPGTIEPSPPGPKPPPQLAHLHFADWTKSS